MSLDLLRARASRRTEVLDGLAVDDLAGGADPEQVAILDDAVGPALPVILDTLGPAGRVAFVLHDMFTVPVDEVARIVGPLPRRRATAGEPRTPPRAGRRVDRPRCRRSARIHGRRVRGSGDKVQPVG